jgi:hypothetical protein
MKRAALVMVLAAWPLLAHAQVPRPERLESCSDAVILFADKYDIAQTRGGGGGGFDTIYCGATGNVYTAGAATYAVADSRWTIAKAGLSLQPRANYWLSADVNAGSGSNDAGIFDYVTIREGITAKAFERFFAKAEHQYLNVAGERGNVVKLAGIAQPLPSMLVEVGAAKSWGGNLNARYYTGRMDWVESRWRGFLGYTHGRTTPLAVDVFTGTRLPDAISRQWFVGVIVAVSRGEIGFAFDELRSEVSRRRTWTVTFKWPLP